MELMVMSALGWKVQTVTAATVLDTLCCLLHVNGSMQDNSCEQMHVFRETCKLILAKALRGNFLRALQHWKVGFGRTTSVCYGTARCSAAMVGPTSIGDLQVLCGSATAVHPEWCAMIGIYIASFWGVHHVFTSHTRLPFQ